MDMVQVLLVEDNADDARMTLLAISRISPRVSVRVARDGEEALMLLVGESRSLPKLVLLDLKLPKIHGLDVLRAMREDPGCAGIPVVVFSSSADPGDIAGAKALGADDYICKPMDWDDYSRALTESVAKFLPPPEPSG